MICISIGQVYHFTENAIIAEIISGCNERCGHTAGKVPSEGLGHLDKDPKD